MKHEEILTLFQNFSNRKQKSSICEYLVLIHTQTHQMKTTTTLTQRAQKLMFVAYEGESY